MVLFILVVLLNLPITALTIRFLLVDLLSNRSSTHHYEGDRKHINNIEESRVIVSQYRHCGCAVPHTCWVLFFNIMGNLESFDWKFR